MIFKKINKTEIIQNATDHGKEEYWFIPDYLGQITGFKQLIQLQHSKATLNNYMTIMNHVL